MRLFIIIENEILQVTLVYEYLLIAEYIKYLQKSF